MTKTQKVILLSGGGMAALAIGSFVAIRVAFVKMTRLPSAEVMPISPGSELKFYQNYRMAIGYAESFGKLAICVSLALILLVTLMTLMLYLMNKNTQVSRHQTQNQQAEQDGGPDA